MIWAPSPVGEANKWAGDPNGPSTSVAFFSAGTKRWTPSDINTVIWPLLRATTSGEVILSGNSRVDAKRPRQLFRSQKPLPTSSFVGHSWESEEFRIVALGSTLYYKQHIFVSVRTANVEIMRIVGETCLSLESELRPDRMCGGNPANEDKIRPGEIGGVHPAWTLLDPLVVEKLGGKERLSTYADGAEIREVRREDGTWLNVLFHSGFVTDGNAPKAWQQFLYDSGCVVPRSERLSYPEFGEGPANHAGPGEASSTDDTPAPGWVVVSDVVGDVDAAFEDARGLSAEEAGLPLTAWDWFCAGVSEDTIGKRLKRNGMDAGEVEDVLGVLSSFDRGIGSLIDMVEGLSPVGTVCGVWRDADALQRLLGRDWLVEADLEDARLWEGVDDLTGRWAPLRDVDGNVSKTVFWGQSQT